MSEKSEEKKLTADGQQEQAVKKQEISETWASEIIEDMDDFIEAQGIYLRQ